MIQKRSKRSFTAIKDFKVVSAVDRNVFQDSDKIHEDLAIPDSTFRFIGNDARCRSGRCEPPSEALFRTTSLPRQTASRNFIYLVLSPDKYILAKTAINYPYEPRGL